MNKFNSLKQSGGRISIESFERKLSIISYLHTQTVKYHNSGWIWLKSIDYDSDIDSYLELKTKTFTRFMAQDLTLFTRIGKYEI